MSCKIRWWYETNLVSYSSGESHQGQSATASIAAYKEPSFVISIHHRKCCRRIQSHEMFWCEWEHAAGFSVSRRVEIFVLFTRDFTVKAGECDGKGLHSTHRVVVVQRENVISYSAKLHHNVVHWKRQRTKTLSFEQNANVANKLIFH